MPPIRHEPLSLSKIEQTVEYHNSLALLWESIFLQFLQKFDEYDREVALQFTRSFKNGQVRIGPLKFKVGRKFVAAAIGLENTGEKWFKNQKLESKCWQCFVKDKKI